MSVKLSDQAVQRIAELKKQYPDPRSVVMPALYIAQEELGVLGDEAIALVAEQVEMAPVHVRELVTFYTMYYSEPVGKYHFQVCRTLSCALRGSKGLMEHLQQRFGVEPSVVTADGMFSYEAVECLGSCGTAPMCEINDTYFENLTPEKLEAIIKRIEQEQPDLRFSTRRDALGEGFKDLPKSEVI